MVKEFLTNLEPPEDFLRGIIARQDEYYGFNLLFGDTSALLYYSNRNRELITLIPGIYSLSNHLLDTPWPKTERSRMALANLLKSPGVVDPEDLFEILSDKTIARDHDLPDTGFGLEWERMLSATFIATPAYGTRASTVLLLDTDGFVRFEERSFDGGRSTGITSRIEFTLTGA
jgi:uncharacterized protein with NRDE domain